ncbi:dihydrolipoamide dehydrogenase [Devosia pacifica]|uniref:Dihydrolipoamide dehydrogenase n=1 Tax=Devosia pacifica TaxID=1335967 RepID=A0A918VU54_9HYPH|nr:NAD(P)/FAD-dependent oxidoreductase [Devosia pacifica]GHA23797.1 dihydrolipoamide dehydrogenase [Devosia pacifica]
MARQRLPDLCVIGGGAGGVAVAEAARRHGASVILVDREGSGAGNQLAGLAGNALFRAAGLAHDMRRAQSFGLAAAEPKPAARAVFEHIRDVVTEVEPRAGAERLEGLGVEVVRGEARFVDRRSIEVDGAQIAARRFVLATGSRPFIPEIAGLDQCRYFTTTTIFDNPYKLTHLVVIGAGRHGLELAQAYRRLGADVSVIDAAKALGRSDPELSAMVLRQVVADGVKLYEQTTVRRVQARSQGIGIELSGPDGRQVTLDASHLLVATGRRPDIETLGLDQAGVKRDPTRPERLRVGDDLKTTNRRIYAIGDVSGGLRYGHAAEHQAQLVVRNALFGLPARYRAALIPRLCRTAPQLAEVGLGEPQVRQRRRQDFTVTRFSLAENDRARGDEEGHGVAKMITDRHGRIVGAGVVGAEAGEVIALFSMAIANGLSARHLAGFVAAYPSYAGIAQHLGALHEQQQSASGGLTWLSRLVRNLP